MSNFEAIRQQLQTYQSENASKFDIVIQMLEGIQAEIQSMKHQSSCSSVHFSTPPTEDFPPHSPSVGHNNEEDENVEIPMASPAHPNKE